MHVLWHLGAVDATTQTAVVPSQRNSSVLSSSSHFTASTQTDVPTQSSDHSSPSVRGTKVHLHQSVNLLLYLYYIQY